MKRKMSESELDVKTQPATQTDTSFICGTKDMYWKKYLVNSKIVYNHKMLNGHLFVLQYAVIFQLETKMALSKNKIRFYVSMYKDRARAFMCVYI